MSALIGTLGTRIRQRAVLIASRTSGLLARHGLPLTSDLRELRRLHRSPRKEVCFLVGNGPSVRFPDLEKIAGRPTFCCNRFFLAYDKFAFRPSFLISSDRQMIDEFGQEMLDRAGCPVIFVDSTRPRARGEFLWVASRWDKPFRFQPDAFAGVGVGGATLVAALQCGFHFGYRKFALYGVDHSFKFEKAPARADGLAQVQGEGNHFISNYRSGRAWLPPLTSLIEEAFTTCASELRRHGGWLKNATRGGALEVCDRADFDEVVETDREVRKGR